MFQMKKLLVAGALALTSVMALAGCGGNQQAASSGSGASGEKVLKVGSSIDFAPFEFQDEGQAE